MYDSTMARLIGELDGTILQQNERIRALELENERLKAEAAAASAMRVELHERRREEEKVVQRSRRYLKAASLIKAQLRGFRASVDVRPVQDDFEITVSLAEGD